jgi:hypothetical protein
MSYRVSAVVPLPDAKLLLSFTNGEQRVFDVAPYMDKGIFTQLKNPDYFGQVRVVSGHVEWPREQDFSPDTLYLRSTPCA